MDCSNCSWKFSCSKWSPSKKRERILLKRSLVPAQVSSTTDLSRPGDFLEGLLSHLLPLRHPAHCPGHCKQHCVPAHTTLNIANSTVYQPKTMSGQADGVSNSNSNNRGQWIGRCKSDSLQSASLSSSSKASNRTRRAHPLKECQRGIEHTCTSTQPANKPLIHRHANCFTCTRDMLPS